MPGWMAAASGWAGYGMALGVLLLAAGWLAVRRRSRGGRRIPVLSVAILVQNQAAQVEGMLRLLTGHLLAQQVADHLDLMVVDCGSTDDTLAILERLGCQYPGLRVVSGPANGCLPACPPAVALAEGRVVVVLNLLGATEVRPLVDSVAGLLGGAPSGAAAALPGQEAGKK